MRLFLALDLPAEVRAELRRTQERLRPALAGWRWLDPDSIHLTLRFLGEVPAGALDAQRPRWRDAAAGVGAIDFRLAAIGAFPPGKRPRVLWAGIEDGSADGRLENLAARLEAVARELGFAAETRRFMPHLTIARAREGGPASLPAERVAPEPVRGRCAEVVLFRSELLPRGARYARVDAYPLAAAGGPAS